MQCLKDTVLIYTGLMPKSINKGTTTKETDDAGQTSRYYRNEYYNWIQSETNLFTASSKNLSKGCKNQNFTVTN